MFTGTAEAGSTITLYEGSTVLGTTTAGIDGIWSITASTLNEGPHSITAKATDAAGNVSPASDALSITIDITAPVVSSITRADPNPSMASTVNYIITFSEVVDGAGSLDYTLATTGTVIGTIGLNLTLNSKVYTVPVNNITGDGTLGLNLNNSGTGITDIAGNAITTGFTGAVYTIYHMANQSITFGTISAKTYGDPSFTIGNVNSTAGLPVTYTTDDPSKVSITGNVVTILKAGTVKITANQQGDLATNPASPIAQTFTINPKVIIVTADAKTKFFGVVNPPLTAKYSGLVNGETEAVFSSPVNISTTALANSPVGTYDINVDGGVAANYSFTYVKGVLTINLGAPVSVNTTNIISPNGDGYNDTWVIDDIERYPNNEVKVFDKAGRIVFQKKGYDNSWEGTLNGIALNEGTYYYLIDLGTNTPKYKGFITIVKSN